MSDDICYLRTLMPSDYEILYRHEVGDVHRLITYRHRGVPPSAEIYPQTLWNDVFLQFVVSPKGSTEVVGLVTCYSYNERNQTGKIAVLDISDQVMPRNFSFAVKGLVLFLDYLFRVHPLRKLYAEVLEWNVPSFSSITRYGAGLEGVLIGHELHGELPIDMYIYGITRDSWLKYKNQNRNMSDVSPSRSVLNELGLTHLDDLHLSVLDSLERISVLMVLEDVIDGNLGEEIFEVTSDEEFRNVLREFDEDWGLDTPI